MRRAINIIDWQEPLHYSIPYLDAHAVTGRDNPRVNIAEDFVFLNNKWRPYFEIFV